MLRAIVLLLFFSLHHSFNLSPSILLDKWTSHSEWSFIEFSEILFTARIDGTSVEGTYWIDTSEFPFILTLQTSYPFFLYMECLYRIHIDADGMKKLYLEVPSDPLSILMGTAERPTVFDQYQIVLNGSRPEQVSISKQSDKTLFGEWENEENRLEFLETAQFTSSFFGHEIEGSFHGFLDTSGFFTLYPNAPLRVPLPASYHIEIDHQGRELLKVVFFPDPKNQLYQALFPDGGNRFSLWRVRPMRTTFEIDEHIEGKWSFEDDWVHFFQTGYWISRVKGINHQGSFYTHDSKIFLRSFNSSKPHSASQYNILRTEDNYKLLSLSSNTTLLDIFNSPISQLTQRPTLTELLDPQIVNYWVNHQGSLNIFTDGSFELNLEGVPFQGICESYSERDPKQIFLYTNSPQELPGVYELRTDPQGDRWISLQLPSLGNFQNTSTLFREWTLTSNPSAIVDPQLVNRWMNLESSLDLSPSGLFSLDHRGISYHGTYEAEIQSQVLILNSLTPKNIQLKFSYEAQKDPSGRIFLNLWTPSDASTHILEESVFLWEKIPAKIPTKTSTPSNQITLETDPFQLDTFISSLSQREETNSKKEKNVQSKTKKRTLVQKCTTCSKKCQRTCEFSKPSKKWCLDKCQSMMCEFC